MSSKHSAKIKVWEKANFQLQGQRIWCGHWIRAPPGNEYALHGVKWKALLFCLVLLVKSGHSSNTPNVGCLLSIRPFRLVVQNIILLCSYLKISKVNGVRHLPRDRNKMEIILSRLFILALKVSGHNDHDSRLGEKFLFLGYKDTTGERNGALALESLALQVHLTNPDPTALRSLWRNYNVYTIMCRCICICKSLWVYKSSITLSK